MSTELRKAGAAQMLIGSSRRWALMVEEPLEGPPSLAAMLERLDHGQLDVVLVEGFKKAGIPKIELHRAATGHPFIWPGDPNVIALAADVPPAHAPPVPLLPLNEPDVIAAFICEYARRHRAGSASA